jgi:hypothetical protein
MPSPPASTKTLDLTTTSDDNDATMAGASGVASPVVDIDNFSIGTEDGEANEGVGQVKPNHSIWANVIKPPLVLY